MGIVKQYQIDPGRRSLNECLHPASSRRCRRDPQFGPESLRQSERPRGQSYCRRLDRGPIRVFACRDGK
jgi:hypothetical protein